MLWFLTVTNWKKEHRERERLYLYLLFIKNDKTKKNKIWIRLISIIMLYLSIITMSSLLCSFLFCSLFVSIHPPTKPHTHTQWVEKKQKKKKSKLIEKGVEMKRYILDTHAKLALFLEFFIRAIITKMKMMKEFHHHHYFWRPIIFFFLVFLFGWWYPSIWIVVHYRLFFASFSSMMMENHLDSYVMYTYTYFSIGLS